MPVRTPITVKLSTSLITANVLNALESIWELSSLTGSLYTYTTDIILFYSLHLLPTLVSAIPFFRTVSITSRKKGAIYLFFVCELFFYNFSKILLSKRRKKLVKIKICISFGKNFVNI